MVINKLINKLKLIYNLILNEYYIYIYFISILYKYNYIKNITL